MAVLNANAINPIPSVPCLITSAILSSAMMLKHIGMMEEGQRIEDAVARCFAAGQMTAELGGTLGCKAFTDAVIQNMR